MMNLNDPVNTWKVEKIAVIGPGIVGMPMAALLAHAKIKIGTNHPAKVVVIQRNSLNSGWKVAAINAGRSVIGGIEPGLDAIVHDAVKDGNLSASHDYANLSDADVILVSVQTDKKGLEPDYGPMFGALTHLAEALQNKPDHKIPLIIFESTLAPSTMDTLFRDHFASYGLVEGKDILLGNSPNRVMPGRLVERVTHSDKLVAGLHPATPKLIEKLYNNIVRQGALFLTNSLTAEVEKTLENAYRDVRIAYSAEIVRYCDAHDIDFYQVREQVNTRLAQQDTATDDPNAVPSGGILIPTVGVGGHCLPKDGILLWWRKIENGDDTSNSLILASREINQASPSYVLELARKKFGNISGKQVAILGAAYRFNSEDTRNSPSLDLAKRLLEAGCKVILHDPYVKPDDQNLLKYELESHFSNDLEQSIQTADLVFFCTGHKAYIDNKTFFQEHAKKMTGVVDACNLYPAEVWEKSGIGYVGVGRGTQNPEAEFVDFVFRGFTTMEKGLANELKDIIDFLNDRYAQTAFNKIDFEQVQQLAASCSTGCLIADHGPVGSLPLYQGYTPALVKHALQFSNAAVGHKITEAI
jgi:UDP-N-acetyl-D-mannosaminuronic acid dehydrogenase